jgi:hypothetical protein
VYLVSVAKTSEPNVRPEQNAEISLYPAFLGAIEQLPVAPSACFAYTLVVVEK